MLGVSDVDECATSTASCQQLCHNVPGSYNCDCYYGYRLAADRTTCVERKYARDVSSGILCVYEDCGGMGRRGEEGLNMVVE